MIGDETRKVVTTLFADVAGSTAVGESLDPETLRRVMSRHFDEARRIVEEHGGVVEKFIGDAVMAVFGIPRVHEDDALRAVRAALAVRDRLAELDGELKGRLGTSISWRIGVNTGQVVAGDAGAGQRFVTGDAVNLAKRLEEAAGAGEVVIGEATHRLVRDAVRVEELEALTVKGKAEPIHAYRLLAVADATVGQARRSDAPMVGRQRQRQMLADGLEQAIAERVCVLFTILGSAGVGKSRLVHEFVAGLDPEVRLLRGRCLSYGQGITFWPIREMLLEAAAIDDDDSLAEARAKLARLVNEEEADAPRILDRVAEAIGLAEGTADPEDTFRSVRRLFEGLARERPLILLFDDVHWAEPSLLDLIEDITDWSRDAPILLLCVGRQDLLEARPTWGGGKLAATMIQLEPLSAAESDELVVGLLGRADLDPGVRQRIAEAADGNPLFVEELLGMLIDDGSLVRDNGSWSAVRDLRTITVPPTIQALLAARLDRLERPERSVIECGAVEGKVFHAGAVTALVPDSVRASVATNLLGLLRKELLRPDRSAFSGDEAYRFRHLLIRDAAYDAMPKQARAELHERFANWLETASGERKTEYEEILGHHLEQAHRYTSELVLADAEAADLARRAADYLASAGVRAADRGDYHASQRLLERSVDLMGDDSRRPMLLERLGEVLFERVPREALERWEEARRAYEATGDPVGAARTEVEILRARSSFESLEPADVIARGEELAALLDEAGDLHGWVRATELVGSHLYFLGRVTEAIDRLSGGWDRVPVGSVDRAHLARWVVTAHYWGPTPVEEAIPRVQQILADNPGRPTVEVGAVRMIGALKGMRGDFDEARAAIARAEAMAAEAGLEMLLISSGSHVLGYVELEAGDPQAALNAALPSYEALAATGDTAFSSTSAGYVAWALIELERLEEAERYAQIALDTAAETDGESQALGRQVRARVLARRGQFEEAERLAREAIAIRELAEGPNGHAEALMALAEVLRLAGRPSEAAEALTEAADRFGQKGNTVMVERTRRLIAGLT